MLPEKGNTPTRQRALEIKRRGRQLGSSRTRRQVHAVDILPRGKSKKGDTEKLVSRGKEFVNAVKDVPKVIKSTGGKPGDKIIGKAAEVMPGAKDPKKGKERRRGLYTKILGATKSDPITHMQVATVKEQIKTFSQFMLEANAPRPDAHKTIQKNWERKHKGMTAHITQRKDGNLHLGDIFVPPNKRKEKKNIGSRFMKGLSHYADKVRKDVTLRADAEKGQESRLSKFYQRFGFKQKEGSNHYRRTPTER
jgi:predicted GNAT family N-acyltransferase